MLVQDENKIFVTFNRACPGVLMQFDADIVSVIHYGKTILKVFLYNQLLWPCVTTSG